jgi:hypothetical protein
MSRLEWNGDAAEVFVKGRVLSALMVLGAEGERRAKELVSVPGPEPSAPGSPPHMQTQELHDGITHEVDAGAMAVRIGTDVPHGLWTEIGTGNMAARPWLRRAAMDLVSRADQILGGIGDDDTAGTSVAGKAIGFVKRAASRVARFFRRAK